MEAVGVRYELLFVADVIGSIFWALCFSVIAYQLCQDLPRSAIMEPSSSLPGKCSDQKKKLEKEVAYQTFLRFSLASRHRRLYLSEKFAFFGQVFT